MNEQQPEKMYSAPGIRITNREIYDATVETRDRVISLENQIKVNLGRVNQMQEDVRRLELRFYGLLAGIITALGGTVMALLNSGLGG